MAVPNKKATKKTATPTPTTSTGRGMKPQAKGAKSTGTTGAPARRTSR